MCPWDVQSKWELWEFDNCRAVYRLGAKIKKELVPYSSVWCSFGLNDHSIASHQCLFFISIYIESVRGAEMAGLGL